MKLSDNEIRDITQCLELISAFHEVMPGQRKIAVKVVDIFGNDTMMIVEVRV